MLSVATNVNNVNGYEVVGAYDVSHLGQYGYYFAGGWIPSDTINKDYLYLTTDAEASETSEIVEVKLLRNETTGQIIGIDNTVAPVTKLVKPYLSQMSNLDPNGKLWYTTVYDYYPYFNCWASWDSTTRTITEEGCNDLYGDQAGLWGMQFVDGTLYGTGPYSFVQVTLDPTTNQPTGSSVLCDNFGYYTGGIGAIPSGVDQGKFMVTDWDNSVIQIVDKDTCAKTDFTSTIDYPWGFFWDPYTNDFFVTTWEGTPSVFHITGYAPGVDLDTVFNNINAAAQSVALLVQSAYARRGLRNERASSKAADPASKAKGAEASLNGMTKSGLFEKAKIKENCQKGKQNCGVCLLFSNCTGKSPNDFFKFLIRHRQCQDDLLVQNELWSGRV